MGLHLEFWDGDVARRYYARLDLKACGCLILPSNPLLLLGEVLGLKKSGQVFTF